MTGSPSARAAIDPARVRLHALGADVFAHVNGTLERHLHRTERLLRCFRSREAVCVAGLYHAVYGTAGIRGHLVDPMARDGVVAMIGAEAEGLAYLYGACERASFHPRIGTPLQRMFVDRFSGSQYPVAESQLRDLCEITLANEIELALGNDAFRTRHAVDLMQLFARMRGLVSDAAYATARRVLCS
jgi:hypothetical protein